MSDAKDLEIEVSTDNVRALCEIGFDLGVQATLQALGISGEDGPGPPNPFRRASTVITQLERVEADAAANARAHSEPDPTGFAAEDADFLEEQDAAQERAQNLYDTAPCFVCGGPRYSHDGPGQNHDFESH